MLEILRSGKNGSLSKSISIDNRKITITIEREEVLYDAQIINFSWDNSEITFAEILENIGNIPIPPYLNRDTEDIDLSR